MASIDSFVERYARIAGPELIDLKQPSLVANQENPWFCAIDQAMAEADAAGKPFVSFGHYDYLDLNSHPAVRDAIVCALDAYGAGAGASRLVGGERSIHVALERELAEFVGKPMALALVSGYLTNATLLNHVCGSGDLVLVDELAHNSIMVSGQGRATNFVPFRHNDLGHLESILKERRARHSRALIAVEGLYSMDGDVVDLPRLLTIKERYDAWLLVDEAHCIGVLGAGGRGTAEHFGVDPARIDLITGTLSKSLVTAGGFIAASEHVIQWLSYTLPGFVFSVGLPPMLAAGALSALRIIKAEPERVARLHANSERFRQRAAEVGLSCGEAIGRGVVPVLLNSPAETLTVAAELRAAGYYAPPIAYVGVPRSAPRIRFFVSAGHTEAQIDDLVATTAAALAKIRGRGLNAGAPAPSSAARNLRVVASNAG